MYEVRLASVWFIQMPSIHPMVYSVDSFDKSIISVAAG